MSLKKKNNGEQTDLSSHLVPFRHSGVKVSSKISVLWGQFNFLGNTFVSILDESYEKVNQILNVC